MKFRPTFHDESEATARKARGAGVVQHLPTNGPGNKQPLRLLLQDEKNANESQFRQMLLLHKKHLSISKEKNGQHFCLFKPFPHDIFREMVPEPLCLLFCCKSNSNNPICVPAALLFHPQQMCLQAGVNHDGEALAVLLGSCETAGRSSTAATRPLPTTSMRLLQPEDRSDLQSAETQRSHSVRRSHTWSSGPLSVICNMQN